MEESPSLMKKMTQSLETEGNCPTFVNNNTNHNNNNLAEEKCSNLRCKGSIYCLCHKFLPPFTSVSATSSQGSIPKVNNNIYEDSNSKCSSQGKLKDGMNDYLRAHSERVDDGNASENAIKTNGLSSSLEQSSETLQNATSSMVMMNGHRHPEESMNGFAHAPPHLHNGSLAYQSSLEGSTSKCSWRTFMSRDHSSDSNHAESNGYPERMNALNGKSHDQEDSDQMNALNGDELDEDEGCIYSYKGENFEDNLSHLFNTCLSCGLPHPASGIPSQENPGLNSHGQQNSLFGGRQIDGGYPGMSPGSAPPRPGVPVGQNNLFSPEMDFLEMDFDPGSTGEGDLEESDCDDNLLAPSCDTRLSLGAHENLPFSSHLVNGESKPSNLSLLEMRHLMCQRCAASLGATGNSSSQDESSNAKLENNVNSVHKSSLALNLATNSNSCLDDRPTDDLGIGPDCPGFISSEIDMGSSTLPSNSKLFNVSRGHDASDIKINNFTKPSDERRRLISSSSVRNGCGDFSADEIDCCDGDSVENNLAEESDFVQEFSEDEDGEDADDERDDSNSDRPPSNVLASGGSVSEVEGAQNFSVSSSASDCKMEENGHSIVNNLKFCSNKQLRLNQNKCHVSQSISSINASMMSPPCYTSSNINNNNNNNSNNNNLGSTSAPEVSPAREFSPLEKFSRSVSFHNQLSSPKYENICFSNKFKGDENLSQNEQCQNPTCGCMGICRVCNIPAQNIVCHTKDTANIEACVHRLSRRENSVFNILSDSSSQCQVSIYTFLKFI